jgi:hypothetical protein
VGTSKKRPPGDSQRARRREIALSTKVPHDGPAVVSVRLDAGGHKGVTGVQMTWMCQVLAPVTQSGIGASFLGGVGNVRRAARMNYGYVQQGGTVGRGKGHCNVGSRLLTANSCNANGSVTGLRTRSTARTSGGMELAAKSFLPVDMSTRAAPALAIATHGVVDIAALDVMPTKKSGGGDMWVGASSTKAEVATVDEVAVGEAEIGLTGRVSR